jgi:hypothetical protein
MVALDVTMVDRTAIGQTIGAVLKHRDDLDRLNERALELVAQAAGAVGE